MSTMRDPVTVSFRLMGNILSIVPHVPITTGVTLVFLFQAPQLSSKSQVFVYYCLFCFFYFSLVDSALRGNCKTYDHSGLFFFSQIYGRSLYRRPTRSCNSYFLFESLVHVHTSVSVVLKPRTRLISQCTLLLK